MKLTVLGKYGPYGKAGTGAASGYLLQSDGEYLVMDMGAGTLSRLMNAVDITKVRCVFISHLHYDHTSDLLPFRYLLEELRHTVTIYTQYENSAWYDILFSHPNFEVIPVDENSKISIGKTEITFRSVCHPVPCLAVTVKESSGAVLSYSGDTSYCESVEKLLQQSDTVLLDCSKPVGFVGAHMTVDKAKELAEKYPEATILATHQSADYDPEEAFADTENILSVKEGKTYMINGKNHYESVIIGHITKDYNIDHENNVSEICGGAVLFSSASAYALGHKVAAVTRLNKKDFDRVQAFTLPEEDIYIIESENSSTMRNQYFTADKERRNSVCLSVGTPFEKTDIDNLNADIYHFAGLVYGDFPNELVKSCAEKGKVAVDVQEYLRHVSAEDGTMFFEDWADKKEMLPFVTFLKTDAAEAEILTGTADRAEAAKILHSWGAKEILITHNSEVLVYDGEKIYTCPIKARNLSGRTGRGDTTFAAYITERLSNGIEQALVNATATVSLKMETPGAFTGTREDVEAYKKEFYPEYSV